MKYGLRVYNPNTNNITIDASYMNQGVVQSGTIASLGSYTIPSYGGRLYKLTYPAGAWLNPSLAVQLDQTIRVSKTSFSNTSSGLVCYIWVSEDPKDLKYYLFASNLGSNGKYGLRVYNDQSQLVFDSNIPYLKILGTAANSLTTWTQDGVPVTGSDSNAESSIQYASSKTLAIMITGDVSNNVYAPIPGGAVGQAQTVHVISIVGFYLTSDYRVHQQRYDFSESINDVYIQSTSRQGYAPSFVIDVTNY